MPLYSFPKLSLLLHLGYTSNYLQETLTKSTCLGDYQNSENGLHGIYTTPVQVSGGSFYTAN